MRFCATAAPIEMPMPVPVEPPIARLAATIFAVIDDVSVAVAVSAPWLCRLESAT